MATQDHLTLRTIRLQAHEEWSANGEGLAFVLGKEGGAKLILGLTARPVRAGDVMVLSRTCGGKLAVPEGAEFYFGTFNVNPEHLFPLFDSTEISLLQRVMEDFKGAKIYPAEGEPARECLRLAEGITTQNDLGHRGQLLRIGAAILAAEFKHARRQSSGYVRMEEHILQVFERLSMSEILNCPVSELAEKFGCSRRHLNRLFHQHFGISVAALKMEMRLLKAVSLLRNPDAKVINVAEECGFNHLGLFNICFKRRFGTSPGQWRARLGQRAGEPGGSIIGKLGCPLRVSGLCPYVGGPAPVEGPPGQAGGPLAAGDPAEECGRPGARDQTEAVGPGASCARH